MESLDKHKVVIGILALQGAYAEHQAILTKLSLKRSIGVIQVRNVEDLQQCDSLIIPGGESTTIALLAKLAGLLEPLREFVKTKPVWGTCAGAILLSQGVVGAKKGGQELLGGISITIARNGWGSQVESFEAELKVDGLKASGRPFMGVFIRAPVILTLKPAIGDPPIKVIARLPPNLLPQSNELLESHGDEETTAVVALRQGLHLLTTFHPELTSDDRFHEYFIQECVLSTLDA